MPTTTVQDAHSGSLTRAGVTEARAYDPGPARASHPDKTGPFCPAFRALVREPSYKRVSEAQPRPDDDIDPAPTLEPAEVFYILAGVV